MQPILFKLDRLRVARSSSATTGSKRGVPPFLGRVPLPPSRLLISGVTKDSTGAVLGSCEVELYRTESDALMERTVSDPTTGAYSFSAIGLGQRYYVTAYKAGGTDVAGTTVNTLVGA